MKLAFIIFKYYPYGGLQRDCLRLANFCASQGFEIHIFTMKWEGLPPDSVKVHIMSPQGFSNPLSNHKRAQSFAKQLEPHLTNFDWVIGFDRMLGLDFYFAGDLCFAETAKKKHPILYRFSSRYRIFLQLEEAVFAKNSKTKIFVLTEDVKNSYQKIYRTSNQRFISVPPGIKKRNLATEQLQEKKSALRKKLGWESDKFYCLQIGSDYKRKGVDRSLHAIAAMPASLQEKIRFYIIGKGDISKYLKLVKSLNISEQVEFLGACDSVDEYLLAADLLIHPAYFETAGMVIVEALSCGLPVLVTENCGYAFHVHNSGAGELIKMPFQQKSMNQQLQGLLKHDLLQSHSKQALDYANKTDLYSMDRVIMEQLGQISSAKKPG